MKEINKNILIISHNPLSSVNNNGKTLSSIFEGVPKQNIYQIYLNHDIPDYSQSCHYLQINEKQIIRSILKGKNLCCNEISATPNIVSSATIKTRNFANNTKRLLRECVWKFTFWKSKLAKWLEDKQFDIVFFMAGDGLFAYDVYCFIMNNVNAKGCMFFTDDYIIGKTSNSPVEVLRKSLLKRKIYNTLKSTKELYVISEEMKQAYAKIFGFNGYVIRNFSIEKKAGNLVDQEKKTDDLVMVYAGGLHYNRWKVLSQLANELKKINQSNEKKCYLHIYSSQKISNEIINEISVEGASRFCGAAAASEISNIYANADILLHVESFEKKSIASTKYSFSTKIPEYLSASKCLLAVGPSEVASICYLSDFSVVISDINQFSCKLLKLINDTEYREKIKSNCEKQFEKHFSKEMQKESLNKILSIN